MPAGEHLRAGHRRRHADHRWECRRMARSETEDRRRWWRRRRYARGSTTHRIRSDSALVRRPSDGSARSTRRRSGCLGTKARDEQSIKRSNVGKPADPRSRTRETRSPWAKKRCCGVPSQASPQCRPRRATRTTPSTHGASVAEKLRFARGAQPLGPAHAVKIGRKLASAVRAVPGMPNRWGKPMRACIRMTAGQQAGIGRRTQAIDLPARAHDGHNRTQVLHKGMECHARNIS